VIAMKNFLTKAMSKQSATADYILLREYMTSCPVNISCETSGVRSPVRSLRIQKPSPAGLRPSEHRPHWRARALTRRPLRHWPLPDEPRIRSATFGSSSGAKWTHAYYPNQVDRIGRSAQKSTPHIRFERNL
jgi:hypothetical protein